MSIFSWLKRRRLDEDDFNEEIRAHLTIAAAERMADGTDRRRAHLASLKDFGNLTLTTEAARQVWTPRWLDVARDYASDIRYAVRALAKHRAFSVTVVSVLTLGIGLNAAVFTMVKGMALSPLAGLEGSARLAAIYGETSAGRPLSVSYPDYRYLRDHSQAFAEVFASRLLTVNLGRGRAARQISGELVTGNYFQALGVRAQRGRTILPSDESVPNGHPVIVLSDGLWRRDFAADPDILGRTVDINNVPLTVVGVADAAFHGTVVSYDVEVFIPVMMAPRFNFNFERLNNTAPFAPSDVLSDAFASVLYPLGYLARGTTLSTAAAEADALWATIARDRPPSDVAQRLRVVPFWQSPTGGQTYMLPTLMVLSAMGLLVLTIACANIAGLVLVRGLSRRGEIAVRLALGATRRRIVRLLILENLVLAAPGAALGLLLAWRGIPPLIAYAEWLATPQRIYFNIDLNALDLGYAALVACASALAFGLVPALRSSRIDLASVINEDASPRGAARGRLRAGLVVAQVAVSLLLLVGAGLATRSLAAARRANPGFDPSQVATIALDIRQNGYDESRGRAFYSHWLEAVRSIPGVESATLAAYHPLGLIDTRAQRVAIDGYAPAKAKDEDLAFMSNTVGSDYFRTLRIAVVAGRAFEDRDDETAAPVAVVSEALAQRYWDGPADAIGRRIRVGNGEWRTVIGVAADVKYSRINESPRPYVYLPFPQAYRTAMMLHARGLSAALATGPAKGPRTGSLTLEALMDQARAHAAAIDADLPILYARPLTQQIDGALIFYNLTAKMLFLFGVAGMALAAMGIYGLVSYTVRQSTHEIGLRMALGASGLSVVRGFLARGLRLGVLGCVLGIVAALGLGRLLGNLLFGVSPTDGASFASSLAIVLGVVVVATLIPAWRASRTDPLSALRHQ